jgi:hypothetical protein
MAMLYPIDETPRANFVPFSSRSVTSLTQDVPPNKNVNCLLLGCGDPRSILLTVFGDEHTGTEFWMKLLKSIEFSRDYDFTCCELEPAIFGLLNHFVG